ncbi:hormogonium polysaccharide biosynthesis protein HpsJ [Synechocystis sp. PCC 7509]|uniref:hormogonium polysaccharide biosynthesis protein HpsJ n=1 Tax=Synechocystis sp. PCC 7509 TaxID=927677 RepID=UPI0002AC767F|nr:HpsJ family protein [Synechocystis sp. PCC 7509]
MKAINNSPSPFIAQTLKLVGIVLILSFLLDFVILGFPAGERDTLWQIGFITATIDRGITPVIGLAFLLVGYWFERRSDTLTQPPLWLSLKFWALLLSSLLGLLFLVMIPLHINNVNTESVRAVERINQNSLQQEAQLQNELNQAQAQLGDPNVRAKVDAEKSRFKAQVTALLQNEQQFNQALNSDRTPEAEKKLLRQFKANPKALEEFLAQQSDPVALGGKRLAQIQTQKQQLVNQAKQEALQSSIRMTIRSLLISTAYIFIGWMGLRSLISANKSVQNPS